MELSIAYDWPALPVGVKNGIGLRFGDTLIVGLGSAGVDLFALDLTQRALGWRPLSPFIGPAPSHPAAAISGNALYVFGGTGMASPDAAAPIVFDTLYRYDIAADFWQQLDSTTPEGLLGANALPLPDGRIALVGGYNKQVFDDFLAAITPVDKAAQPGLWAKLMQDFMSQQPEDYRWNNRVLAYDPARNTWGDLGPNPYLPNCGSGVVETAPGVFALAGGEVKPGLRTNAVKSLSMTQGLPEWALLAPLPDLDGVAGAFAGRASGKILLAGGTRFPGAQARAAAGQAYAHEGLTKVWDDAVMVLGADGWVQSGTLPKGLAYGASFALDEGTLVVGGEDATGAAQTAVYLLR